MAENLKALVALISNAVENIDARYSELGTTFPSLRTPIPPDAPPTRADPVVMENASVLLSAATQLIATVKSPHTYIFNATCVVSNVICQCYTSESISKQNQRFYRNVVLLTGDTSGSDRHARSRNPQQCWTRGKFSSVCQFINLPVLHFCEGHARQRNKCKEWDTAIKIMYEIRKSATCS